MCQRTRVDEFVECEGCGFVLVADGSGEPAPQRADSCPDCGGESFAFTRDAEREDPGD